MTLLEAMLYYATGKNNVFSEKQLDLILDKIISDLANKKHLSGHLALYREKTRTFQILNIIRNSKLKLKKNHQIIILMIYPWLRIFEIIVSPKI